MTALTTLRSNKSISRPTDVAASVATVWDADTTRLV